MPRKATAKPQRILCALKRNPKGHGWMVRRLAVTHQGLKELEPVKGFREPTQALDWIKQMAKRDQAYEPYPKAVDDEEEYELELPPEDYEPYQEEDYDQED